MHTLRLSVSLPDENHPDMELRVSADELACDIVISMPAAPTEPRSTPTALVVRRREAANDTAAGTDDAYVLGGYAGI